MSTSQSVTDAADEILITAGKLAAARFHEMSLEDERPLVKMEAVKRIMARDGIAATPAEKIVESDDAYMEHRRAQYAAVVATQYAWAEYERARVLATHAADHYRISEGR